MIRNAAVIALLLTCLGMDGSRPPAASNGALEYSYGSAAALQHARMVHEHLQSRRFREAAVECRRGYAEASREKRWRAALFYLTGLAGAHFKLGEYRKAQEAYIEARELGLAAGMPRWSAIALANLSSLYMHASDTDSALAAAREAQAMSAVVTPEERSDILLQLGRVLLHRGESLRARPLFAEAIRLASESGNSRKRAAAWDQLGLETLQRGLLEEARPALRRALFLRTILRDPNLFATEHKMAELELRLGHVQAARRLIDSAFAHPMRSTTQVPLHLMYLTRAQVLSAQEQWNAALEDYGRAVEAAEEWRGRSLSADSFRVSADIWLTQIYEGAVHTAARLHQETGDRRFAEQAWQFAERSRQASLREGIAAGRSWTKWVPPAYWAKLEQLRTREADHFSRPRNATAWGDETTRLRMQLAEMEAAAGAAEVQPDSALAGRRNGKSKESTEFGENNPNPISLRDFGKGLGNSRVFISFVLGENTSYRWVISREGLQMKRLPGKRQIVAEVEALRAAIQRSGPDLQELSHRVFANLFGGIRVAAGTHWHIAMDDRLFDLPVAALVVEKGPGGPSYLVERQSFDFVPGAWAVGRTDSTSAPRRFVGIGDGIYNIADPRYPAASAGQGPWFKLLPSLVAGDAAPLQLPRLAASRTEVESAARHSGAPAVILTGSRVSREELVRVLSETPQLIHIAAHFLVEREGVGLAAVVLGVAPDERGKAELRLLTASDIRNLRVPGSVVAMSGCSSGTGRIVPTAGVLGLARSWLTAGANAVVATQWPTLDDSGEIFSRFYAHLARTEVSHRVTPAEALRRAQIDMLRSGTWRSEPKHWAAYQLIQRSN